MSALSNKPALIALAAMIGAPLPAALSAQEIAPADEQVMATVYGEVPADISGMPEGPEVDGFISARAPEKMQVTTLAGTNTVVNLSAATEIKSSGGFLGLSRKQLDRNQLLNGLPVTVETVQWGDRLIASKIKLKSNDLETAAMIRNGTSQRFAEHDVAIEKNAAATEALRSRMGDIDKYNIKGTTNVYFDTGKWNLSPSAQSELCTAAAEADAMDNALILVVGYTDSVGDEDYNQVLSERRAGKVVNYLQQKCGWKPWRMISPTGMAESDPLADNDTEEGRAQNRRVSVNILVSKAVDEI